jgi:precorrin-6A/cobalt-precorrin-6A reductase
MILILGGTGEARRLAAALVAARPGERVVSSLAGRLADPLRPDGELRVGGFGGVDGLAAWLRDNDVDALIDATHPFAIGISRNAVAAADATGVPLLVLRRPGWSAGPGDRWHRVAALDAAAAALADLGERVFLTTGRQSLAAFAGLDRHWFLVRTVDRPDPPTPARMRLILDRGPFTLDGEHALLRDNAIDVIVTKDSGGDATVAKLVAARERGLPVVLVDRPPLPSGVTAVADVDAALAWAHRRRKTR